MPKNNKTPNQKLTPQEENAQPPADSKATNLEERRGFLVKSGALLAALGMSGVAGTGSAFGQEMSAQQGKALQATMDEAIKTKNAKRALQTYGKDLPADVQEVLSQLSPSDLRAAASLNAKLSRLRKLDDTNNNGYIGM